MRKWEPKALGKEHKMSRAEINSISKARYNVHMNHVGILFKHRFSFSRSGVRPKSLQVCLPGDLARMLGHKHLLSSKAVRDFRRKSVRGGQDVRSHLVQLPYSTGEEAENKMRRQEPSQCK